VLVGGVTRFGPSQYGRAIDRRDMHPTAPAQGKRKGAANQPKADDGYSHHARMA
jgi:hypothetical protein